MCVYLKGASDTCLKGKGVTKTEDKRKDHYDYIVLVDFF